MRPFSVLESLRLHFSVYYLEELLSPVRSWFCLPPSQQRLEGFIIHWMANVTLKYEILKN